VVITETRIENRDFAGVGVFRGYSLTQHSSSGFRRAGVSVFAKKGLELIEGSTRNARDGHSTLAAYKVHGEKIIIAAIYGPSCNSDNLALEVVNKIGEDLEELGQLVGTRTVFVVGDFNLKLETKRRQTKPRAVNALQEIIEHLDLKDAGAKENEPTWRRPHLPGSNSRIDYIMYSNGIVMNDFKTRWGRFDHAEIQGRFELGAKKDHTKTLKDWALLTPEFLEGAPKLMEELLLDHDKNHRWAPVQAREEFTQGRLPRTYEAELDVMEGKEGVFHCHVLMVALTRLTSLQARIQKEHIGKRRKWLEELQLEIGKTYQDLDLAVEGSQDQGELAHKLENLKMQIRDDTEQVERAGRIRLENYYADNNGKNKAASFLITREPRSRKEVQKLVEEDLSEVTTQQGILDKLEGKFKATVGEKFQPEMELTEFLAKYQVELPSLSDELREMLDEEITINEVRDALSSAKAGAAPGPSGQTAAIFKYLLAEVPSLLVKSLNELTFVPGLARAKNFEWMFARTIKYIPKPGKSPDRVGNLRPLSLLESLYKLQTRVLSNRLTLTMDEIIYENQHGFRRDRGIQTATLPVLDAIHDAGRRGQAMQVISVDLKSAFDCVSPQLIRQVMELYKFPEIYVEALHQLTHRGKGRLFVNSLMGNEFDIENGTGQGDPPSAGRFNIGTDPLLRALNKVTERYRYRMEMGRKMPVTAFADDHQHVTQVGDAAHVQEILEVYSDFAKVSGLHLSIEKTVMMCINTDPDLIGEILNLTGIKQVEEFRYLGIQLCKTQEASRVASYQKVQENIKSRYQRINSSYVDLFHRRQLIKQTIMPSFNHVFMVFGHDEENERALDGMMVDLLWTRSCQGQVRQGRRLVAKKRLDASFNMGGLNMDKTAQLVDGLLLNMLKRLHDQSQLPEDKRIFFYHTIDSLLVRLGAPNLEELFRLGGSRTWGELGDRVRVRHPFASQMFGSMAKLMELNENSGEGWLTAPLAGHSSSPPIFRISVAESLLLEQEGLLFVGQLFKTDDLTGRPLVGENREYGAGVPPPIGNKCRLLRSRLNAQGKRIQDMPGGSFGQITKNAKLSQLYRHMHRAQVDSMMPGPPAYFTRRRDGIPVPPLMDFMKGYSNLFKLNIPSKTLEASFLLLNRQT
jgi:hypothetical protein